MRAETKSQCKSGVHKTQTGAWKILVAEANCNTGWICHNKWTFSHVFRLKTFIKLLLMHILQPQRAYWDCLNCLKITPKKFDNSNDSLTNGLITVPLAGVYLRLGDEAEVSGQWRRAVYPTLVSLVQTGCFFFQWRHTAGRSAHHAHAAACRKEAFVRSGTKKLGQQTHFSYFYVLLAEVPKLV